MGRVSVSVLSVSKIISSCKCGSSHCSAERPHRRSEHLFIFRDIFVFMNVFVFFFQLVSALVRVRLAELMAIYWRVKNLSSTCVKSEPRKQSNGFFVYLKIIDNCLLCFSYWVWKFFLQINLRHHFFLLAAIKQ